MVHDTDIVAMEY